MADEYVIRVVVVDDIAETRENIRKLLQFESDIEVVGVARTGKEGIDVATETQPDVVLMDINMPDMDGITATELIREKLPATQIVILSVQSDSNYMRRAMLAGARDFLTKPPDLDELTAAIRRAGEMAQEAKQKQATADAAVKAAASQPGAGFPGAPGMMGAAMNGKLITVYGPKGGVGTTTITANLGILLHSEETPTLVVDARLQFGDISFFFNEQGKNNIADLAPRANELDVQLIKEILTIHPDTSVNILPAPPRPEQAESVTGAQFGQVLQYVKNMFAYVVVDAGSYLDDTTLASLDASDLILTVTTQDIPSIKNVRLFLELARALGIDQRQLLLVMSKFDKRRNITPERVSELTKLDLGGVIPLEERLVIPAMDRGVPFITQGLNNPVAKGLAEVMDAVKNRLAEMESQEAKSV